MYDSFELEIAYLPVSDLKPYTNNTRKHDADDISIIAKSIEKYGFNDPIGIWGEENIIVEGHGRLLAAKKLGMDKVPCYRLDHLTETERREYAIAHNRTAEFSEWDMEALEAEMADLEMEDFDLKFEFDHEEPEVVEDDYEEPLPEEPKSKPGQIYQLGRHRLMCGDSTKLEDVQKLCNGVSVDMLLTDPPYMVDYEGNAGKIKNDNLGNDEALNFLKAAFENADAVMKKGAVFYIWHADSKGFLVRQACQLTGWEVRQCLIWVKNSLVLGRQDYQWRHEPCLYGWKAGASHLWASDRKQSTVLEFDKPKANDIHPTMKPVLLFDYQMKNNTKGGDIVLDLFCGSGTTIVAAEQNGRTAICMEYDPKYVDAIIDRWEKLTGEKAELVSENEDA